MPQQPTPQVENSFTKGLLTEFTGLNFPENAATDTDNCIYTLVGNVTRREGIDNEIGYSTNTINRALMSLSSYKWNNAGGDGLTQVVVKQVGSTLYFYLASSATVLNPLSNLLLGSTVVVSNFTATGQTFDPTKECTFSDGNGYLFVYHPDCDPFYCSFVASVVTANPITLQIRDFVGLPEPFTQINTRPNTLSQEHLYNLTNQGWTQGAAYQGLSTTFRSPTGTPGQTLTFTVQSSLGANNGDIVSFTWTGLVALLSSPNPVNTSTPIFTATVTNYTGTTLTVITDSFIAGYNGVFNFGGEWIINPINTGYITTFFSDIGLYPSNSDQWWSFKDNTDSFNPSTTAANVTLNTGYAPKGHYILPAFLQQRTLISSVTGLTDVTTMARPTNGSWYAGRVWYTGVNAQQPATGDAGFYTWTENIYFSQVIQDPSQFGYCYQLNDPTAQDLFGLLPTDGGVITISGAGAIYRLFPIANGMLVHAANGIWFITGSQGIGFSANDYTITKISSVRCISSYSFVSVNGMPMFWNEEGIYAVEASQQGQMQVNPLTVGTILTFYNDIPYDSKVYARGDYDPINYVVQWVYKSVEETSVTDRYTFDSVLNLNTYNKAFYPYSLDISNTALGSINGIIYVASPGGINAPDPALKYITSVARSGSYLMSFGDEHDETFQDWASLGGENFVSYFVTGYRLTGQAQRRIQIPYIYTFSRGGLTNTAFYLQSIWDYATSGNTGRWSTRQQVNNFDPNYAFIPRRHRLRGQGLALQIKVSSVDGQLFDLMGWSTFTSQNTGV